MKAPYTRILIVALVLTLTVIHSGALLKGIPFYGTPRRSPRCSWQPVVQDALKEMRTSAVNRYEEAVHVLAFVLVYLGLAVAFIGLVRTCLWVSFFGCIACVGGSGLWVWGIFGLSRFGLRARLVRVVLPLCCLGSSFAFDYVLNPMGRETYCCY